MKIKCNSDNFFKIYNEMQGVGIKVSKLKSKKVKVHSFTHYIFCVFNIYIYNALFNSGF